MDHSPRTSDISSCCPTCTVIQLGNRSRGRELLQRRGRSDGPTRSRLGFLRREFVSSEWRAPLRQVRALVILSLGVPNFALGGTRRTIESPSRCPSHSASYAP